MIVSSDKKAIQLSSALVPLKTTRTASGVTLLTVKKNVKVVEITEELSRFEGERSLKKIKIPATGIQLSGYELPDTVE